MRFHFINIECFGSTTFGMSLNTKKSINTSSNKRCGRMLGAKEKNRMREQNYANLQKRIKILLDEDDSTFGERLNKLTHDDKFKKRFNKVLQDDLFQEKCNRMMKDKHFRQKFSELNNNNNCESQFFSPLDDSNNNVEENSDPFKYFNNLEEYFDELKSKNDNKEKIMNALRRHNSCASIPNGDTKRTTKNKRKQYRETKSVPTERAPTESVETVYVETESVETLFYEAEYGEPKCDTPSKIRRNNDLERSIEPYKYKGVVEVKPFSDLPDIIKDMDSLFESEVIRYYKLRSENKGRYSYKGQDNFGKLLSFLSKNRVFIPLLSIPITVFIDADPSRKTFLQRSSADFNLLRRDGSTLKRPLSGRPFRILQGEVDLERQQRYAALQKRIKVLLDEDDNAFGERLNALAKNDHFRKQFNTLLHDDLFKRRCGELIQSENIQKNFNALKNNDKFENQSFPPMHDSNNHVEENSDPFKYYNNLEEYFDELKSKNDNKEKIIYELKRESSYKGKQNGHLKHINHDDREPVCSVERDMSINLRNTQKYERHLQPYMYSGLPKRKKKSMGKLHKLLVKMDSQIELKPQYLMTIKAPANGHHHIQRQAKCESLLSCVTKKKILVPKVFVPGLICLIPAIFMTINPVSITYLPIIAAITAVMSVIGSNMSSYALK
ncbi:hypothetical protein PVIIG_02711 [Plasmodium vivax India VII]|uniref:Pv-fam-d protein n=1 Tax=Plasmodium vivax India VII TaxID=1077284 RepID=A0A0J9SE90_PLAVI|nr:hypothetical protein PVIIG_02711 [Plasmodium vivax India VII]